MSTEQARIGVVGCGWWATTAHLPSLDRNAAAEIVAVADPDQSRREAVAAAFDVRRTFADASALIDNVGVDGVVIAAPHALHYELAALALSRGLHVLLEKPMVLEPEHGRKLIELARDRRAELIVGYPWHYNKQARLLRTALIDGSIGSIEYVSCQFSSTVREFYRGNTDAYRDSLGYSLFGPKSDTYSLPAEGGQARTQVTHSAALLFWLTGLRPQVIGAMTAPFELDVDLADAVAVRFAGGAIGTVGSTGSVTVGQDELFRIELFGTDGHVIFDVNGGEASIHGQRTRRLPSLPLEERYPQYAPAENLVQVIMETGQNESPPEIGLLTAEFIAAIHTSAAEGRLVEFEPAIRDH